MTTSSITKITNGKPGPTLAIFAGVHGNEKAGVFALQELLPSLTITKGKLFLVFANPPAIKANVRMVNKNLNRCFIEGNKGSEPEDVRARELMKILDECDALLDLHMFYDDSGLPFVICENNALDVASKFDVDTISTNWVASEPGATDGYMYTNGKVGICVECGPISKAKEYTEFAKKTIYQFLKYFGMTHKPVAYSQEPKRIIRAQGAIYKTTEDFKLSEGLRNFDKLSAGQIIATEANKTYKAKIGECIIFPHYNARIGEEAYIIGTETKSLKLTI